MCEEAGTEMAMIGQVSKTKCSQNGGMATCRMVGWTKIDAMEQGQKSLLIV